MTNEEKLYVGTAPEEHVEMYLKAMWLTKESSKPIRVSTIANLLRIRQPSVVQMMKKLNDMKLIKYTKLDIQLTDKGEKIGSNIVRKSRLLEVLMVNHLKIKPDDKIVCGMEHHMNDEFTNSLSTILGDPKISPNGKPIPSNPNRISTNEDSE
ncbi:metal-dependent transcriptional regulator [Nitrosopumilus sp.]|uniref:metal-dependent transcriptional regulator n=1 Tax=Nitrosopumilus sp. TaxID=2024843 RepID=UPI00260B1C03|nr:metal-dependent transcriptional regulator [Nitrosopumilus sp.]